MSDTGEKLSAPNSVAADSQDRLALFKPTQVLTLGDEEPNKKVFTPHLNVAKTKNKGPNLNTSRDKRKNNEGKTDRKNNQNRKIKNGSKVIKAIGVFTDGGTAVATLQKPTVRIEDFRKTNEELEVQKIKSVMGQDMPKDKAEDFRQPAEQDAPIRLPMDSRDDFGEDAPVSRNDFTKRASSSTWGPSNNSPKKARRRLAKIAQLLRDSGSESDGAASGSDDDEVPTASKMREAARKLRNLLVLREDARIGPGGTRGRGGRPGQRAAVSACNEADIDEELVFREEETRHALGATVETGYGMWAEEVRAGDLVETEMEIGDGVGAEGVGAGDGVGANDVGNEDWVEAGDEKYVRDGIGGSGKAGKPNMDYLVSGEGQEEYTFSWSENFETFSGQEEVYTRDPGPRIAASDPSDIFLAIWDVAIMSEIVQQTNHYAWQTIAALSEHDAMPKSLVWEDTTIDEMQRLFAILILMSLSYRPRVNEYWTTGVLGMPEFRSLMSRNRFQTLMRFLHFVNNNELPTSVPTYQKKIAKIAPVFEYVTNKFSSLYTPERELSLDETLLSWKGRLSWEQCIRTKAARFGVKSFELCESSTGYLLKSVLYAGTNFNRTAKILELLNGFLGVGHLVAMDTWYNQLRLTRFLKQRKTDVLGSINKNAAHLPPAVKAADGKLMQRGQLIARHCGDITVVAWRDVKLVTVMSTYHNDEQVVRQRGGQPLLKPVAVEDCNKSIRGVDLKDTKLNAYPMELQRLKKWYLKVFARLLNTAIFNSYIIYRKHPMLRSLTHRQFRYTLAESLLKGSQPIQVTMGSSFLVRLDRQPDHFPVFNTNAPGSETRHRRLRCRLCWAAGRRKETTIICSKCNVALCIGQCWRDHHTLQKLKYDAHS